MIDDRSDSDDTTSDDLGTSQPHRGSLVVELTKLRDEAAAEQLDVRAAQINSILQELPSNVGQHATTTEGTPINAPHFANVPVIESWDQLREALTNRPPSQHASIDTGDATNEAISSHRKENTGATAETNDNHESDLSELDTKKSELDLAATTEDAATRLRTDGGESKVRRPNFLDLESEQVSQHQLAGRAARCFIGGSRR